MFFMFLNSKKFSCSVNEKHIDFIGLKYNLSYLEFFGFIPAISNRFYELLKVGLFYQLEKYLLYYKTTYLTSRLLAVS